MTKLAGGVNCRQKQLSELLSLIKVDNYIFKGYIKLHYLVIAFVFSLFACTKSQQTSITQNNAEEFKIIGNKIYNYKNAIQLIGSNAFHVFGAGGSDLNVSPPPIPYCKVV